jgi:hypothetical protein
MTTVVLYKGFIITLAATETGVVASLTRTGGQPIVIDGIARLSVPTDPVVDEPSALLSAKIFVDRILRGWIEK